MKHSTSFPLTNAQLAYYMGRTQNYELGDTTSHVYYEFQNKLNIDLFEQAFNLAIRRHAMLRTVFHGNGMQEIIEETGDYHIPRYDFFGSGQAEWDEFVSQKRETLSHEKMNPEQWPLFRVESAKTTDGFTYLFFSFDLLIADGSSLILVFRSIMEYYDALERGEKPDVQPDLRFMEYVEWQNSLKLTDKYREDRKYWESKAEDMQFAPDLLHTDKMPEKQRYKRLIHQISPEKWDIIKKNIRSNNEILTSVLFELYGQVLSYWSGDDRFTVALTMTNRGAQRGKYLDAVGDFTSLILLPYENSTETQVYKRSHKVTRELMNAYRHSSCDGFEVEQIISRKHNIQHTSSFDIVFTSMLDESDSNGMPMRIGRLMNSISQTPQVKLDCQLLEIEKKLEITWDYLDGYYRAENMELAFSQYIAMIENLAISDCIFELSPGSETETAVEEYNSTAQPELPYSSIIPYIKESLSKFAEKTAFKDENRSITFRELDIYSEKVKNAIISNYPESECIAVKGNRSVSTIIYIIGIIRAGRTYVPVNPDYPADRVKYICEACNCQVYFDSDFFSSEIYSTSTSEHKLTAQVTSDSIAYIIYTSGSTGLPKGVEITHGQLCNTIFDMNSRLGLNSNDVFLNVSAFSFDLSVFDIFSGITSGACVFISGDARDIRTLKSVIKTERVTVLNCVPSVVQLIMEQSTGEMYKSLRHILMSGDFIPLMLPGMISEVCPNAELLSLGGATEGTIWSIAYPINAEEKYSDSIPYGYPLANQTCYVLDSHLQLCPTGVKGTIFIGGKGVAKGYHNDDEKTESAFIYHSKYGRIYNTGDIGIFTQNGFIRILGRKDGQVKINGFRVETGEIEKVLADSEKVSNAVVIACGTDSGKHLLGYIVPHIQDEVGLSAETDFTAQLVNGVCSKVTAPDIAEFNSFYELTEKTATEHMKRMIAHICRESNCESGFFTPEMLIERCHIKPLYTKLIRQWLHNLATDGCITENKGSYCVEQLETISDFEMDSLIHSASAGTENSTFILNTIKYGMDILKGEKDVLTYLFPDGNFTEAEVIYRGNDISRYFNELAAQAVARLVESMLSRRDGTVRILEIGAGVGGTTYRTAELLEKFSADEISYTFTDISNYFLSEAEKNFRKYPFMNYRIFDIDKTIAGQEFEYESYDIILSANVMHDARNINHSMKLTSQLLAPGGVMVLLETTTDSRIQMISTHMIEGYSNYEDFRIKEFTPLISSDGWEALMKESGYAQTTAFPQKNMDESVLREHIIFGMRGSERHFLKDTESEEIIETLRSKLPPYMIPAQLIQIDEIPLTVNGKVNRAMLPVVNRNSGRQSERIQPQTETEHRIFSVWSDILGTDDFGTTDNFFTVGGDSIMMVRITAIMEKEYGYQVSLNDFLAHSTIKELAELLDKSSATVTAKKIYIHDEKNAFEEFPLTSVQLAYLVGGTQNKGMGSITTQAYYEIKTNWDIDRLEKAVNQVIRQQPMLHAVVSENGTQRILSDYPDFVIRRNKYTSDDDILNIRRRLEGKPINPHCYPLFEIEVLEIPDGSNYLFLHFNLIIADGASMQIMIRQLYKAYHGNNMDANPNAFTFRDYVCCKSNLLAEGFDREDAEYWHSVLPDIPPAPPIADKQDSEIDNPHFRRMRMLIPYSEWKPISAQIAKNKTTPASFLLAMYCKVLGYWTGTQDMTINVTTFDRMPLSDNIDSMIGDFTTLALVPVSLKHQSLWEQVHSVQQSILQSIGHSKYDGIHVMRDYRELSADSGQAQMPVVFTSMLFGDSGKSFEQSVGEVCYSVSQTPQVHLDCQVMENTEGLSITWDYVEELFETGKIERMFSQFEELIRKFADGTSDSSILQPSPQFVSVVEKYNSTESATDEITFQELIENGLKQSPDSVAVIDGTGSITYGELDERSESLAERLKAYGAKAGVLVAVECRKDIETVVRLIAVARSGAGYVPFNEDYPEQRKQYIISQSGSKLVMRAGTDTIEVQPDTPEQSASENLAYVIYTSGSTGTPKGVEISKSSIANTLVDMRDRMNLTGDDVFAVITSFCFDLSVFDLFESVMLHSHLIVIPDPKDIRRMTEMLTEHRVTVINCVPATAELIAGGLSEQNNYVKTVLMSGDFIPQKLPEKIMEKMPCADVWSLGGATEASVWSIAYQISRDYDSSQRIPYGYPLANQTCYVLDYEMRLCPQNVTGEICIGGKGVAMGYRNASELTESAFYMHPDFGRIYRTGDLGKAGADGCIHILGRADNQVKINGFRVETGEIERVLEESSAIERAVVVYNKDDSRLVGYIKPSVRQINNYGIQQIEPLFENICTESSIRMKEMMSDSYDSYIKTADESVINQMKQIIYELISNNDIAQPFTLEMFFEKTNVRRIYIKLIRQWFAILIKNGLMTCEKQAYSLCYDSSSLCDWHINREDIQTVVGDISFISKCRENLKEILTGSIDILQLLFPDGRTDVADELYKTNQISAYYNQITADVIGCYADSCGSKISVMEIGAGTGATSAGVLEKIKNCCDEYLFTDISDFFAETVKKQFSQYSFMRYRNYDINISPYEQDYPYEQYDVILASNVMHDATDLRKSLCYAMEMLRPDGILVLQEMTTANLIQMVSTRLIEGYSDFDDFRLEKNSPILEAEEWKAVLQELGFETVICFPDEKDTSDIFGEHIILAKKSAESCYLSAIEMKAETERIREKLPDYMIPAVWVQLKELPLTYNQKVNIKALPKPIKAEQKTVDFVPPETQEEVFLWQLWSEQLGHSNFGITDDFFLIGGDSLKAIRTVALINEHYKLEMTEFFESPVIKHIAPKMKSDAHIVCRKLSALYGIDEFGNNTVSVPNDEECTEYELKANSCAEQAQLRIDRKFNGNILLFGATGYLGCYMLRQLLANTSQNITVIVRSADNAEAQKRVQDIYRFYFGDESAEAVKDRINAISGDFTKDNFNLDSAQYNELAQTVDCVINTAAMVKHQGVYDEFYRANVRSVENIIRFASTGIAKIVHHVSSNGIMFGNYPAECSKSLFTEYDCDLGQTFSNYYLRSKMEAEKLIMRVRKEQDLNINIYRAGSIMFDSESGHFQRNMADNTAYMFFRAFTKMGIAPTDLDIEFDITFVDQLADAMTRIILSGISQNDVYHMVNPNRSNFNEAFRHRLIARNLRPMNFTEVCEFFEQNIDSETYRPYIQEVLYNCEIMTALNGNSMQFATLKTEKILEKLGFVWSSVSDEMLAEAIQYAEETSYI